MKRFLSVVLAMTVALNPLSTAVGKSLIERTATAAQQELQEGDEFTEGNIRYRVLLGGIVEVCGVIGDPTQITIPYTTAEGREVYEISNAAFSDCQSLTAINVDPENKEFSSENGVLFNKDKTKLLRCPQGKKGAYVIPDSVTAIGDNTFYSTFSNCTKLTSVTIPKGVTEILFDTFSNCTSLTSVTIPDGVTWIESSAFKNCTSLTSVKIPNSVTYIGEMAFENCKNLTSVTLSDNLGFINKFVFKDCTSLTSVKIPNGAGAITDSAFQNCTSLTSIDIPSSVQYIDRDAFGGCKKLASVTISNGVIYIYNRAFSDCTGLTSITIPSSVKKVEHGAFVGCTNLTSAAILNRSTTLERFAFAGSKLKDIYYAGSKAEWEKMISGLNDEELLNAAIHYNSKLPVLDFKAALRTPNSIKLSWGKNVEAESYKVWMMQNGKWVQLTQTKNNSVVSYTKTGLQPNTSYKFRIRAYSGNIMGDAMDITVKTKGKIANLKSAPTNNSVKLTWSKNTSASYYKVFVWKDNKWNKLTQTKNNSVLNYTVKSLAANTSYKFRVSGYDKNGKEFAYSDVTVKTKGKIANLKAAPTNNSVKLTWSKNASASYYKVFVWKDGKWNKLTQTKNNSVLNYTVKSLSVNTSYKYRVSGYDKNGKEFAYSDVTVKTKGKIANLKAAPTNNSAKLTWSKNASASYYKVFVWKDNKWNKLTQTKNNSVLNYTVKSLSANTSYKFRVSGYDKNGKEFAYSDVTVKTKGKIANLKAAPAKNSAKLTWSKNASASYYKVFVWKDNKWNKLTQTKNNSVLNYTVKSLSVNTSYKYRVSGYDKNGKEFAYSDVTVKTKGKIANLKAAPTNNSVKLTWSKNASASYYKVFVWKDGKWNKLTQTKNNSVLNYTAKSLAANTSYKFRVSAYNKSGKEFAYSDVTVKTKGKIANLKAAPAKNSAKLTWSKNASASYYKVFYWNNGKWNKLTQTNNNAKVSCNIINLKSATSYKFRVSGYDKNGKEFAYSDVTVKI